MCKVSAAKDGYCEQQRSLLYLVVVEPIVAPYQHTSKTDYIESNVECIQYDIKHNLVLDGILVY